MSKLMFNEVITLFEHFFQKSSRYGSESMNGHFIRIVPHTAYCRNHRDFVDVASEIPHVRKEQSTISCSFMKLFEEPYNLRSKGNNVSRIRLSCRISTPDS